jgi:hypothetical protein
MSDQVLYLLAAVTAACGVVTAIAQLLILIRSQARELVKAARPEPHIPQRRGPSGVVHGRACAQSTDGHPET